ncbi:MAG: GGDEF domain-containing protein [Betaproteobacteria bacterium]|nr:GGDEF domain-containing protein [Betaproteobacteria bacterium]
MTEFGKAWRRLWKGPDPAMLVAGGEGERQVAVVRMIVVAFLLITPIYRLVRNPGNAEVVWGFVVTLLAMFFAVFIHVYLRHRNYRPWLGFLSTCVDGSLVSSALLLFVIVGSPLDGVNDKVTFEVYFLVLMAISLRQDRRICLLAGGLIVLQYGLLFAYVDSHYDLNALYLKDATNGSYSAADQWTRIILLGSAVLVSYAYVARSETLVNRAIHDPMTGLLNRGFFEDLFHFEIDRAYRYRYLFAVVVVDADHFKRINDTHGHLAGDVVLKALAKALRDNVRESDMVVRYGGEEFVLLLQQTGAAAALEKVEALRAAIETLAVVPPGAGQPIHVTVSAGIAIYPDDGDIAHILLSCADQRLLEAKQSGRNRVIGSAVPG